MRYHSVTRVLDDINKLKKEYDVRVITVEDDMFFLNKKRAMEIISGIRREGMIVEFSNGISVPHLDETLIDALVAAGVKMVTLAVESGCKRVLREIIHKQYTDLSIVHRLVAILKKKGICTRAVFVIGFPGETKEELLETVDFMKKTGFNWVCITIATPLPGSELFEVCKKNNLLLTDKVENLYIGRCNIRLSHSTPEELEKLRYLLNLEINFVNNYDLKNGSPDCALINFQDVIDRVPNYAFAQYYASQCHRMMGNLGKEQQFLSKYREIVHSSKYWNEYTRHFGLPV